MFVNFKDLMYIYLSDDKKMDEKELRKLLEAVYQRGYDKGYDAGYAYGKSFGTITYPSYPWYYTWTSKDVPLTYPNITCDTGNGVTLTPHQYTEGVINPKSVTTVATSKSEE